MMVGKKYGKHPSQTNNRVGEEEEGEVIRHLVQMVAVVLAMILNRVPLYAPGHVDGVE